MAVGVCLILFTVTLSGCLEWFQPRPAATGCPKGAIVQSMAIGVAQTPPMEPGSVWIDLVSTDVLTGTLQLGWRFAGALKNATVRLDVDDNVTVEGDWMGGPVEAGWGQANVSIALPKENTFHRIAFDGEAYWRSDNQSFHTAAFKYVTSEDGALRFGVPWKTYCDPEAGLVWTSDEIKVEHTNQTNSA